LTSGNTNYLVIACALLAAPVSILNAQLAVYRWIDANGVVHFGDSPPDAASGLAVDTIAIPSVQTSFRTPVIPPAPLTSAGSTAANAPDPTPVTPSVRVMDAQTEQCSDPSPTIRSGIDLYEFNAEATPLEPQYVELFRKAFGAMQGRWHGPDSGFYCVETGSIDEERLFNRMIEAEGDLNPPDRFVLDATLQSQGSNRRENLRIELRDRKLVVNSGAATMIRASDGELEFGYKVQLGGTVTEYYWQVTLAGTRAMTLRQRTYTQGDLSASSIWNLTKGR
jgi:hypothetical protein